MSTNDLPDWTLDLQDVTDTSDLPDWTWAEEGAGTSGNGGGPGSAGPVLGYSGWWKADAISGYADGATLGTWVDNTLNNTTLFATGAIIYYLTTPGQTQNGLPTLSTPGSAQALRSLVSRTWSAPIDVQWVARSLTTSGIHYLIHEPGLFTMGINGTKYEMGGTDGSMDAGTVDTGWHTVTMRARIGAGSVIRVDGAQVGSSSGIFTGAHTVTQEIAVATVIGAFYWQGNIAEILAYPSSTLDLTQIQANEAYLKAKWGTP